MSTTCKIVTENGLTEIVEVTYSIVGNEDIKSFMHLLDELDFDTWFENVVITSDNPEVQKEIENDYYNFRLEVIPQLINQ